MPLVLLTALALCFLAANSLLTRAGVVDGTDPLAFAAIRVAAGAVVLAALAARRGITVTGVRRWGAAIALVVYLLGFSLAYRTLDAGIGALILFATVQIGLFALSLARGERSGPVRLAGMGLALAGLVWLLLPGGTVRTDPMDAGLMIVAGLAWAAYSFAGKFEPRPLAGSAGNFLIATALFALAAPMWWGAAVTPFGAAMAALSGGIASGIGYAMLFRVLPQMGVATAGVAQLIVPVIATLAGAILLGEVPGARALAAGGLVLAGIGLATIRTGAKSTGSRYSCKGSRGS
ncbi:MAG: DMT family transporter [Jannaschia helgolandensis]|jgi:drug/metabolite transporter (DMT)-like permease|uniref:Threonine/homoserine efflux transporter RhtA n=1 Tax=Jannaschia helgolandensis TaxID=188906 RepID=A0A1H7R3S6_9RHOB|nr:DMT family transporter [Jannaschia helgolandensis]SEL54772.1 Threonine/homoserine efflux transporter RhtA [Jannaschia helgolandensis]